jgi:hypothetical protein
VAPRTLALIGTARPSICAFRGRISTPCALPEDAEDKHDDYVMVGDSFTTGWHATELAGVKAGETVV